MYVSLYDKEYSKLNVIRYGNRWVMYDVLIWSWEFK